MMQCLRRFGGYILNELQNMIMTKYVRIDTIFCQHRFQSLNQSAKIKQQAFETENGQPDELN